MLRHSTSYTQHVKVFLGQNLGCLARHIFFTLASYGPTLNLRVQRRLSQDRKIPSAVKRHGLAQRKSQPSLKVAPAPKRNHAKEKYANDCDHHITLVASLEGWEESPP